MYTGNLINISDDNVAEKEIESVEDYIRRSDQVRQGAKCLASQWAILQAWDTRWVSVSIICRIKNQGWWGKRSRVSVVSEPVQTSSQSWWLDFQEFCHPVLNTAAINN